MRLREYVFVCMCTTFFLRSFCVFSHCGDNYLKAQRLKKQRKLLQEWRGMMIRGRKLGCRQHVERMNCIIKKVASAYWLPRSWDRIVEECPGSPAVPRPEWEIARARGIDNELPQMKATSRLAHTCLLYCNGNVQAHKVTHVYVLIHTKWKCWYWHAATQNYQDT